MVFWMVLAWKKDHKSTTNTILDAFHHRRHSGETKQCTNPHQGDHRVGARFVGNFGFQLTVEVCNELSDFARLLPGQVFR